MKKISLLAALVMMVAGSLLASGCNSDPHDTHIATSIAAPR